jgi:hypothetical protein
MTYRAKCAGRRTRTMSPRKRFLLEQPRSFFKLPPEKQWAATFVAVAGPALRAMWDGPGCTLWFMWAPRWVIIAHKHGWMTTEQAERAANAEPVTLDSLVHEHPTSTEKLFSVDEDGA